MVRRETRILVTAFFVLVYVPFLIEVAALALEFGGYGLGVRMATLFAHNFLFFPVVGVLVLIAFWRPTTLIVDALLWNKVRFGRFRLAGILAVCLVLFAERLCTHGYLSDTGGSCGRRIIPRRHFRTRIDPRDTHRYQSFAQSLFLSGVYHRLGDGYI